VKETIRIELKPRGREKKKKDGIGGTMPQDEKKGEKGQGSPLLGLRKKRGVKEAGVERERMTTSL
jgi:hypothetical protein